MNEDHENDFLIRQLREARELASDSDLVDIRPLGQRTYAALFRCNGLVQERDGTVRGADRFVIEIQLAEDHLRTKPGPLVMRIVYPPNCFAPNVAPPLMCAGDLPAGVGVVDLVFQAYEIISWQNCTIDERENGSGTHETGVPMATRL